MGAWYRTVPTGDSTPLFRILLNLHSRLSLQFTRNFEYKIDHIWKTNNCKKLNFSSVFVSEHCTTFGTIFFCYSWSFVLSKNTLKILRILKTKSTISQKKKSQKSDNCFLIRLSTFRNIYFNMATFEGKGGGGLHIVNWDKAYILYI